MRKSFILSAVIAAASVLITGAAASCYAADSPTVGDASARIGYVDFNRALNEVSDGKQAKKRLRNEFKEKQDRLTNMQKELNAMKKEIDRDRLMLSSDVLKAKESTYRQKLIEVQGRFADFRREMSEREEHLTEEILKRLRKIVKGIGNRDGYALILEKSQDVVIYAPKAEDLTSQVIKQYNRGSKGGR